MLCKPTTTRQMLTIGELERMSRLKHNRFVSGLGVAPRGLGRVHAVVAAGRAHVDGEILFQKNKFRVEKQATRTILVEHKRAWLTKPVAPWNSA